MTVAATAGSSGCSKRIVASFLAIPFLLRFTGSMRSPAMSSVQLLVGPSLFGSFWFGGISSPLLPWFLIAMVLGFFYLANSISSSLTGIALQLRPSSRRAPLRAISLAARPRRACDCPTFLDHAALTYMTMLGLFYEAVMRVSLRLEQETIAQRGS